MKRPVDAHWNAAQARQEAQHTAFVALDPGRFVGRVAGVGAQHIPRVPGFQLDPATCAGPVGKVNIDAGECGGQQAQEQEPLPGRQRNIFQQAEQKQRTVGVDLRQHVIRPVGFGAHQDGQLGQAVPPVASRLAEHRKVDRRHPVVRVAQNRQTRLVIAKRRERQPAAIDGSRGQQKLARGDGFQRAAFEVAAFQRDAIRPGPKALCQPAREVREIRTGFDLFDCVPRPVYATAGVRPEIHIGLRVGLPVAQVLRKHCQQALPQVEAGCFVAFLLRLIAPQNAFRVGVQRQRRLDHAMVQVGDQRGERVICSAADSGLSGGAGVIPRHGRRGDPDPLQFIVLEGKAVGAPTDAEPSQTGAL